MASLPMRLLQDDGALRQARRCPRFALKRKTAVYRLHATISSVVSGIIDRWHNSMASSRIVREHKQKDAVTLTGS
eukprot:SAG31_NODE_357_length_17115_cov_64.211801_11_plen_75_part_00